MNCSSINLNGRIPEAYDRQVLVYLNTRLRFYYSNLLLHSIFSRSSSSSTEVAEESAEEGEFDLMFLNQNPAKAWDPAGQVSGAQDLE